MIEEEKLQTLISAFSAELQAKGYRGNFTLVMNDPGCTEFKGNLYEVLKSYGQAYRGTQGVEDSFRLYTYAYFRSDKDYIHCALEVCVDEAFGFKAHRASWEDAASGKTISERLYNNVQIPAAKSLFKKFPRRGIWQKLRGSKLVW